MSDAPTVGYSLRNRDTGAILKFGETTGQDDRYSKAYLELHNAELIIEASGSKPEMHKWQHEKILEYTREFGERPSLNKSDY